MAVTQAQIAKMAGVSRGTVDRVLNNRGRVNPKVEARIRQIAAELGYQRNRAGSLLVRSKRPLRIGVVIQSVQTSFMACVLAELERERGRLAQMGAKLLVRRSNVIDLESQLQTLDELRQEKVDGIALTPVEDERICRRIDELAEERIPVVTFNSDMPGSRRICYVGQDGDKSGRACAGLMNMLLGGAGKVLMVGGHASNLAHRRRIEGFQAEVQANYPGLELLPLVYGQDDRCIVYKTVKRALLERPDIRGIYLAANGQAGVSDAIREMGDQGRVHFICHDLLDETIEGLQEGLIDFVIDQNAHMQAVRPPEVLLDYLLTDEQPAEELMLARIDIRTRYNI